MMSRTGQILARVRATLCTFVVLAAVGAPTLAIAQADMSDFNPGVELRRVQAMPNGFTKVQRFYYLGDLSSNSGRSDIARDAYAQALATYDGLHGNNRTLAVAYAAQAALGLAGLTHLEFRKTPLQWASYEADSAARWKLLTEARREYARVLAIGYPRATFEALYLRAHLFEEWNAAPVDSVAEATGEVKPIARAIRHLDAAKQLYSQAADEYRRIMVLQDSLGLVDGTGDDDVSEWVRDAKRSLAALPVMRDSVARREEALQARYAELECAKWSNRAMPLLWKHAAEMADRDAGVADPFFDYYLQAKLVNEAYRPFLFGPGGYVTAERAAADSAQPVRSSAWEAKRLAWSRHQEWLDTDVSRRLARIGLNELHAVPAALDSAVNRFVTFADTLPPDARKLLTQLPPAPDSAMPAIPDFGDANEWSISDSVHKAVLDKFLRYQAQMKTISDRIDAYRKHVTQLGERVAALDTGAFPPALQQYARQQRGFRAARVLLLDTLGTMVFDQVNRAIRRSRAAAVWVPPGQQTVAAQQAIDDFVGAAAGDLNALAALYRDAADRYRAKVNHLDRRPPSREIEELAESLDGFADRADALAARLGAKPSTDP